MWLNRNMPKTRQSVRLSTVPIPSRIGTRINADENIPVNAFKWFESCMDSAIGAFWRLSEL